MQNVAIAFAIVMLLAGCKKKEAEPQPELRTPAAPIAATGKAVAAAIPIPNEEPSEDVLRKLMFEQYEALGKVKDLRIVHPSSGQSAPIHPKLHKALKEYCNPTPYIQPGTYECHMRIWITLTPGDRNPGEQGARIGVKWDSRQGKWVEG